jgi:DNA-binding MarR family transcriptional regulator
VTIPSSRDGRLHPLESGLTQASIGGMAQPATRTPRSRDASRIDSASATLDRVLELLERAELSATEMRILLALLERRDATIAELADVLDTYPAEITRAGRRLAMRGLIRWHHGGRPEHALLDGTVTGAATIEALLASLGTRVEASAGRPRPQSHPSVDEMSESSFPASDPPSVWTWEVHDPSEDLAATSSPSNA